mgnify:CR=1 FL=1
MKDFLGQELKVGDEVVYMYRHTTGSSSSNKTLKRGFIKRFTPKQVVVDTGRNMGNIYYDEYKANPDWVVLINK